MSDEARRVERLVERMTAALVEGDLDAVMSCYEGAALVLFEPGQAIVDPEAQRRRFAELMEMKVAFTYPAGHEAHVVGDLAVHIAPWRMTATAPDGTAIEDQGLSVAVLRKQDDGTWKLVIDNPHGSARLPR